MPTLNAATELPALLAAIERQTLKPFEVLIIDSSSGDDTPVIARNSGADLLTIKRNDFDHGRTRNLALTRITGEFVVFTVQDATPAAKDWLEHLIFPLRTDPTVGMVTGRQFARPDASPLQRLTRELTYGARPRRSTIAELDEDGLRAAFCSDANAAYRVRALRAVGGFPQPCIVNEDMAAAVRLMRGGYALVYEPRAAVVHSHPYTATDQLRRHFDIGVFLATSADLAGVARPTRDASHYLRAQLSQVFHERRASLLAEWCWDVLARTVGTALGMRHRYLPHALCLRLTRHPAYWSHSPL